MVLVDETLINQRCHAYFHKLLNEVGHKAIMLGDFENSKRHGHFGYYGLIIVEKVTRDTSE